MFRRYQSNQLPADLVGAKWPVSTADSPDICSVWTCGDLEAYLKLAAARKSLKFGFRYVQPTASHHSPSSIASRKRG